jgi:hypothetical protein
MRHGKGMRISGVTVIQDFIDINSGHDVMGSRE